MSSADSIKKDDLSVCSDADNPKATEEEESVENEKEEESLPLFKYKRVRDLPPNFFVNDPVSTCTMHERANLIATHSGIVCITDRHFNTLRTFKAHNASVLSAYTDGEYFATGSMDGTVVIGSLLDTKDIIRFDFKRPIHCVILEKDYSKTKSFITGGMSGKVLLSTKSWLGNKQDVVLDESNGPIVGMQLLEDILIWMDDRGIVCYALNSRSILKIISRPKGAPRGDLYWPRIYNPDAAGLIIAWGYCIWSIRIQNSNLGVGNSPRKGGVLSSDSSISFRRKNAKSIEIEKMFQLNDLIAGISSYKDDELLLLIFNPPEVDTQSGKVEYSNPDLKILDMGTGSIVFEEEIGLKNIEHLGLNDYELFTDFKSSEIYYYIFSAKDAVIAQKFSLLDQINWYATNGMYLNAWECGRNILPFGEKMKYGTLYMEDLIKEDKWVSAADFLKVFLKSDTNKIQGTYLTSEDDRSVMSKNGSMNSGLNSYDACNTEVSIQWNNWASIFIKSGHIDLLIGIIPDSKYYQLDKCIYNSILLYCTTSENKHDILFEKLQNWSPELYDFEEIEKTMEEYLENHKDDQMERCLVNLYIKAFDPSKAVKHLERIHDKNIIQFLCDNHIVGNFKANLAQYIKIRFSESEIATSPISDLLEANSDVIDLLVKHRDEVPVTFVLDLMQSNNMEFISYAYLEKLASIDSILVSRFADMRIQLYCKFDRAKLLPFLSKMSNYNLDSAIKLCETNDFVEELVYLLGKVGQNQKAIELIITRDGDPQKAIRFAKLQHDEEVWNILLEYAMNKPNFIKALIENADEKSEKFYTPITIIQRMSKDVRIEGLKKTVSKISEDNELMLLVNQLILRIVESRSQDIATILHQKLLKGYEVCTNSQNAKKLISSYDTIVISSQNWSKDIELQHDKSNYPFSSHISYSTQAKKMSHLKHIVDRSDA